MNAADLKSRVEEAWADRTQLQKQEVKDAIANVMAGLDVGALRVAEPLGDGSWQVNEWVKQAVLLNFPIQKMVTHEVGPFEFHDKMPLKKDTPRRVSGWCLTPWCAMERLSPRIAF